MSSHLVRLAAVLAVGAVSLGCAGRLKCGDECTAGSPYAFMTYDCSCETCGPGCSATGGACGDKVSCGDACTCGGGGCADGTCPGGSGGGPCGGKCGGGCACGKPTPCWALNVFCRCAGCGELYWNEWYNDPPACAEPCDCYGNWIGAGNSGYYRAPYLAHGELVGAFVPNISGASPKPEENGGEAARMAERDEAATVVDESFDPAVYDDADLDAELQ